VILDIAVLSALCALGGKSISESRRPGDSSPPLTKKIESQLVFQLGFFDGHVAEFAGIENVAAIHAHDKFSVFIARDDLHTGVLALGWRRFLGGEFRRRDGRHKPDDRAGPDPPGDSSKLGVF